MNYRRSEQVIARPEGDQTLVFHQGTGWIGILNPSSTFIWEQCGAGISAEEVAARIGEEFALPGQFPEPSALLTVVRAHLELMRKGHLLETIEA